MKDAISVLQTLNSINFIKNIKEKINNQENATINEDYLAIIEKSYINDDILDGKNFIEKLAIKFLNFFIFLLYFILFYIILFNFMIIRIEILINI